jgi:hypothetical protein
MREQIGVSHFGRVCAACITGWTTAHPCPKQDASGRPDSVAPIGKDLPGALAGNRSDPQGETNCPNSINAFLTPTDVTK